MEVLNDVIPPRTIQFHENIRIVTSTTIVTFEPCYITNRCILSVRASPYHPIMSWPYESPIGLDFNDDVKPVLEELYNKSLHAPKWTTLKEKHQYLDECTQIILNKLAKIKKEK
jgi:hypothetical protein